VQAMPQRPRGFAPPEVCRYGAGCRFRATCSRAHPELRPGELGQLGAEDLLVANALGVEPNARSRRPPPPAYNCFCDDLDCPAGHPLRARAFASASTEERGVLVQRYTAERRSYGEQHQSRVEEAVMAALREKPPNVKVGRIFVLSSLRHLVAKMKMAGCTARRARAAGSARRSDVRIRRHVRP